MLYIMYTSCTLYIVVSVGSTGEFFFDKAVNGFLRELFEKWWEAGCNHDVTIAFFWRLYYDPSTQSELPQDTVIHK